MTEKRWSKHSHQCYRCPKDGSIDNSLGCPKWWKTVHTNIGTGEIKVVEECGDVQIALYLTEVIKASNRPAAAVESMRNEMVVGLGKIVEVAREGFISLPPARTGAIEDKRDS